ncbi:MAG: hypothetical protein PHG69_00150 [Candidatus Omnitrophica bacterium]|nr:hypothetical protein [Candidatus Omnitrophota bacterium]
MKKNTNKIMIVLLAAIINLYGCKSINVGGNARAGTVSGDGHVTISIPKK